MENVLIIQIVLTTLLFSLFLFIFNTNQQEKIINLRRWKFLIIFLMTLKIVLILYIINYLNIFNVIILGIDSLISGLIFILMRSNQKKYQCKWWGNKPGKQKWYNFKSIPLGVVTYKNSYFRKFNLNLEDIKRHILIYGQTGTGKSSFLKYFLLKFNQKWNDVPFTLFEFKGEYNCLEKKIPNLKVFRPGENFSINLFDNEIFSKENYVEVLFDSLKSCRIIESNNDFSPQMEKVLTDVLKIICLQPSNQGWNDFERILTQYNQENQVKIPQLSQTIISIKNRLRRFYLGPLRKVFNNQSNRIGISELISKNSIIDLSNILKLGGSKQDMIFFSNLILKSIWETAMNRKATDELKHLTIFEDISYIASKKIADLSEMSLFLEDIALLLRGKGEALISLSTSLDISKNIILNSGTKFFFKFNEKLDDIVHHVGLENQKYSDFRELPTGLCITKCYSQNVPFLLFTNHLRNENKDSSLLKNAFKFLQPVFKKTHHYQASLENKKENLKKKQRSNDFGEKEQLEMENMNITRNQKKSKQNIQINKEIIKEISEEIHNAENLIFFEDYTSSFQILKKIFTKFEEYLDFTSKEFDSTKTIIKRFKNLEISKYNKENGKVFVDDCLIALKIIKILKNHLISEVILHPDAQKKYLSQNDETSKRSDTGIEIWVKSERSDKFLEFYNMGCLKKIKQLHLLNEKMTNRDIEEINGMDLKSGIYTKFLKLNIIQQNLGSFNLEILIIFTTLLIDDTLYSKDEFERDCITFFNKLEHENNELKLGFCLDVLKNLPKTQANSKLRRKIVRNSKIVKEKFQFLFFSLSDTISRMRSNTSDLRNEKKLDYKSIEKLESVIKNLLLQ